MRIAYTNLVDTASSLTASTSATNYPVANVQDQRLTTTWRSTAPSAQTVIVDLGSTASVQMSAVLGHNLTSAASITIAGGGSASAFASAETISWNAGVALKYLSPQNMIGNADCEGSGAPMVLGETTPVTASMSWSIISVAWAHGGAKCLQLQRSAGVGTYCIYHLVDDVNANKMHGFVAGSTRTISIWMTVDAALVPGDHWLRLDVYYAGDWHILATSNSPTQVSQWTQMTLTATIPANATGVDVLIISGTTGSSGYSIYVDDLSTVTQSFRYWKFTVDDPTNPAGYVEAGRLWLGDYLTVDPSSMLDFKVSKKRSDNVIYGRNRQKFASPGVGWRRFELSFPRTHGTMLTAIQTMYDTVGKHSSLIFCNFDTDVSYPIVYPCYCSIQEDIDFAHAEAMKFTYGLVLEEDL